MHAFGTVWVKVTDTVAGKGINPNPDLEERVGVESPVVAGRDGKALEGGPGGVSQQGQQLLPCPSLLQHSCEEVRCPAASHAVANTL